MTGKYIVSFLLFSTASFLVRAQYPKPDSLFGYNGIVTTDIDGDLDKLYKVILQPDGKIIAAGYALTNGTFDFALARYNENGSPDLTFSNDGKLTTPFGADKDKAYTIALQNDGKMIAAGSTFNGLNFDFALARYLPNGMLDSTFGINGKVVATPSQFTDVIYEIALQPDGKIVAAGYSNTLFTIMRFLPNGIIDPDFGNSGMVKTAVATGYNKAFTVLLQPDGKIIAGGIANNNHDNEFALLRYLPNGLPDSTFGLYGIVTADIDTADDFLNDIVLQPDGKIIAAGSTRNPLNTDFVVHRYNTNGSPDSSFNNTGELIFSFGNDDDECYSVFVMPNGKIMVAGSAIDLNIRRFAIARINSNGSFDSGFGFNGKFTFLVGNLDYSYSSILLHDNKILMSGFTITSGVTDFTLLQLTTELTINSINEENSRSRLIVFPNPSTGDLTIVMDEPGCLKSTVHFVLYDLNGKIIYSSDFTYSGNHSSFHIQIPETIPPGIYNGQLLYSFYKKTFSIIFY